MNIYPTHVNKWLNWMKSLNAAWMKRMDLKKKTKAYVKLWLHFLFCFTNSSAPQQAGNLGLKYLFISHFDRTAIMLCHKQVSLHINCIYQLVQERTAPDSPCRLINFYPQILVVAAQPRILMKMEYGMSVKYCTLALDSLSAITATTTIQWFYCSMLPEEGAADCFIKQ